MKPNPDILQQIIAGFNVTREQAVYVGDSRHKDVAMAQDAGIDHAWAKYGEAQDSDAYEMLKSVTHWTDEDVEREAILRQRDVSATIILERNLSELMDHFKFGEFEI